VKVCTTCGEEWPDEIVFCQKDGTALRSAGGTDELIDTVVADRYHIKEKLGEGGMGAVYLGEHVKMGRKSAIKVMSKSMANDPDAIARFNREAANASRINHPNVCAIYDFGETSEGLIYLAMEFIPGESLTQLLDREGALPAQRAAKIITQVADALAAAHELGLVHRDLKPDNVMVTAGRDGSDLVKVVDFGIAKAMGTDESQQVTRTGLVVGTPEYMSPEQLSGDQLDGRSDLYSLALVLYRTLTNTLPFQADTAQEIMIKRLTDAPLCLNDALPGANFPQKLQDLIDWGLQRMPGDRCADAAAFGQTVAEAVREMPEGAAPPVDTDGATQLLDAPPPPLKPTAELPETRVSGRAIPMPPEEPTVARPSPPAPRPRKRPVAVAAVVALLAVGVGGVTVMATLGGDDQADADAAQTPAGGQQPIAGVTGGTVTQPNESIPSEMGERATGGGGGTTGAAGSGDTTTTPTEGPDETGRTVEPPPEAETSFAPEDAIFELLERFDEPTPDFADIRSVATAYYSRQDVVERDRADFAHVIAMTHWETGAGDLAITWAERALSHNPSHSGAAALLQGIRP
jgi:serine/threonine-protein kinase